jgi:type IV pilus assembly protein PilY1
MRQTKLKIAAVLFYLCGFLIFPPAFIWADCANGVKIPAFLSSGIDPNLLLIIDNSASMNDLAYIGTQGTCYDDGYSPSEKYAGYFDDGSWYAYSLTGNSFSQITDADAVSQCSSYSYKSEGQVCISVGSGSVSKFIAKGNLLNWVAASKLDVQKKILTGGKFESNSLVMESRGCLGRRYVKKVQVKNSSGSTFYLTLGVRPPQDAEKLADPTDDITRIEIYEITTTGFNNTACQRAINELQKESPNHGQIKQDTEECMSYTNKDKQLADAMGTFNHSMHDCWYWSKQNVWPPGAGSVSRIKNDCEKVYGNGVDPEEIGPEDRAYACFGSYPAEPSDTPIGYVGSCWNGTAWTSNECVDDALKRYCQFLEIPEVVDPSDQAGMTGEFWNIPAVLIDSGVIAQMAEPWLLMKARIAVSSPPSGLIQEVTEDIRIGAMIFNYDGSRSECSQPDPYILYKCSDPGNKDGGKVLYDIGQGELHVQGLVSAINQIKATSWTPLAEALYNAIGYYTQNDALRLNSLDFRIDCDPVTGWCQSNNILLITDGGSTADLNSSVFSFASPKHPDTDPTAGCGQLAGSTLLNDLTYYAKSGSDIYPVEQWREIVDGQATKTKQNITTHIVVSGELRTIGTGDCSPDSLLQSAAEYGGTTLYNASNPSELETKIRQAFAAIRSGAASGSAASVISSSRGGEGALYQATFWPSLDGLNNTKINWTGEVHALFVNDNSEMLEDTNRNGVIDNSDARVLIYYDKSVRDSKACYGTLNPDGSCSGTSKKIQDVKYLWSASEWLNAVSDADILSNRSPYLSSFKKRYIFTWNDLNNDGVVDHGTEILPFADTNSGTSVDWASMVTSFTTRGPVTLDFGVATNDEVNRIVRWIRGQDQTGMRSRQVAVDANNDGVYDSAKTWRLGDVIHSTPIPVSRPSEAYHTVYRDSTYAQFANHYKNRRHVIYFGGNDGMVHAINGGFYDGANKRFCRSSSCASESTEPELGAELWAYVPYNLVPHLKCLTEPAYSHKYYVDLQPRIFDVQIFPNDATHPGGWGTIMVIGMGFGGAKVVPGDLDLNQDNVKDFASDDRIFTSAYMIFDVTNPESPPVLLGEFTRKKTGSHVDIGFTTSVPAIVPMKSGSNTEWYLIIGSGPNLIEGESTQTAKIGILPLKYLTASAKGPFQIPDSAPSSSTSERGRYELTANSFVGDIVSVDFDLSAEYKSDAVYFGTVQGSFSSNWSGKLYRLVTQKKELDINNRYVRIATLPHEWSSLTLTNPAVLIDANQPVTAAPAIGWDGRNYWVYFGTGRFLDEREKSDNSQQSFYGIKEPQDCNRNFTWASVERDGTHDGVPGNQGLLRVDEIQVYQSYTSVDATLSCKSGSSCLPDTVSTFSGLVNYIVGSGCSASDPTGTDGWYMQFAQPRERNLGQGVLLGGLLTFTTYQPYDDVCLSEGLSNLYGVYYQTGTGWYKSVFGANGITTAGNTVSMLPLGHGLSKQPNLHVGQKAGSTVFLQSSTGAILEIQQPNLPLKNTKSGKVSWNQNKK